MSARWRTLRITIQSLNGAPWHTCNWLVIASPIGARFGHVLGSVSRDNQTYHSSAASTRCAQWQQACRLLSQKGPTSSLFTAPAACR